MTRSVRKYSRAGGSLLAIAIIVGVVAGTIAGETSIGFLVGLAAGLVMLGYVFLADRQSSADPAPRPHDPSDDLDR